jgi:hypothetical protein
LMRRGSGIILVRWFVERFTGFWNPPGYGLARQPSDRVGVDVIGARNAVLALALLEPSTDFLLLRCQLARLARSFCDPANQAAILPGPRCSG